MQRDSTPDWHQYLVWKHCSDFLTQMTFVWPVTQSLMNRWLRMMIKISFVPSHAPLNIMASHSYTARLVISSDRVFVRFLLPTVLWFLPVCCAVYAYTFLVAWLPTAWPCMRPGFSFRGYKAWHNHAPCMPMCHDTWTRGNCQQHPACLKQMFLRARVLILYVSIKGRGVEEC